MKQRFTPLLQHITGRVLLCLAFLFTAFSFGAQAQLPVVPQGYGIRVHAAGGLLAGQSLQGIAADRVSGNIYVAAPLKAPGAYAMIPNFNLYKVTPAGEMSLLGNYVIPQYSLIQMVCGPDGKIYLLNASTGKIMTIDPVSKVASVYANSPSSGFHDLNFDPAGNLIIGFESMFSFYKIQAGTNALHLGTVTAPVPNGNHGDAFGIQPNGNYVVYSDCGGQNNYAINTAGHVAGTSYPSLAWTGTSNLLSNDFYGAAACGYSNGCIDPVTGDVYSTVPNFDVGNSMIVFTPANGGASSLFVTGAGNGIVPKPGSPAASGITDMVFGKATNGCGNSLFFTDRYQNKVYEVYKVCNQPPAVTCPANITVNADAGVCGATVTYPEASATGIPVPSVSYSHPSGSFFPVGTTTVTVTASNTSGPDATCTFTVTVNGGADTDGDGTTNVCDTDDDGDGTPDAQDCQPLNAAVHPSATEVCNGVDDDCDGTVDDGFINTVVTCPATGVVTRNIEGCTYTVDGAEFNASVSQNCGALGYTLTGATTGTGSSLAGVELNAGETVVTWSATNATGQAISCSFTVKVVPPVPNLACPENTTLTAPQGQCGAVVNYTAPSAPPACNSISPTTQTFAYSGQVVSWIVPAGVTSITIQGYGAEGGSSLGESSGRTFTGGLGAGIKGTFAVIPGETINILVGQKGSNGSCGSGGGGGTFVVRKATNELLLAAGGGGGGFYCDILLGRNGGPGLAGQNGGSGLVDGMPADYVSSRRSQPGGSNGQGGSSYYGGGGGGWLSAGVSTAMANGGGGVYPGNGGVNGGGFGGGGGYYSGCCGGSGGGGGYSGGSGGVSDGAAGGGGGSYNAGTSQENVSGVRSGNGQVTITYGTASYTVTQTEGLPSGATFPVGETINTFEISDGNGNTSTCSFTVTVKDEEAPTISCPENIIVEAAAGECTAVVSFAATAADNCGATVLYYLNYDDAETRTEIDEAYAFPIGMHTVTAVAKDASGNETTCTFSVTVKDVTPPTFVCPQNTTVELDASCTLAVPDLVSGLEGSDACGTVTFTQNPAAASLIPSAHGSTYLVTITASDGHGNTTSCEVTLTAADVTPPVLQEPADLSRTTDAGQCGALVAITTPGATDNCSGVQVRGVRSDGLALDAQYPEGVTTITWTARDAAGLTDTYVQTITIRDEEAPLITCPAAVALVNDAGVCQATNVSPGVPVATDVCGIALVVGVRGDGKALSAAYPVGTTTIMWTATDVNGNTASCTQTVTVRDNEAPHVITRNISRALSNEGTVNITAADINNGSWDNCAIQSISVAPSSFNCTHVGSNTVTLTVTDIYGNTAMETAVLTITPLTATTTVAVNPATQQYSDQVTFSATVWPGIVQGDCTAATHVTFMMGDRVMGKVPLALEGTSGKLVGVLHTSLYEIDNTLSVTPGEKDVTALFTGVSPAFIVPTTSTTLTVTPEVAEVEYTGTPFVSTPNIAIGTPVTITVPLRMSVQDISAVAGSGDDKPGNVSRAKARFIHRETGQPITGEGTDGQGWKQVTLINPADSTLGTVAVDWKVTLPGSDYAEEYTVDLEVGGPGSYYQRNNTNDKTVITVSRPAMDFVTGGGTLLPGTPSGQYAPAAGRKINFGFNLKYNKSGKNLQGSANIVYRRVVNGQTRVFQIKGNSMTSMGVNTSSPDAKEGSFVCKANLVDVTDPLAPISYGGGHVLEVKGVDKGDPGTNDQLAITLYTSKGALLFSSNWSNRKTVEKQIASGNVVVSGGGVATGTQVSPELTEANRQERGPVRLSVKALPNPTTTQFTLVVESSGSEPMALRITDKLGRIVETRSNLPLGSSITLGSAYRPGAYFVEVVQGSERATLKLLKL